METEAAAKHGGDRKSDQSAENKNGTLKRGTNSRTTRIARLKRDHPEVAKRVEAREAQKGNRNAVKGDKNDSANLRNGLTQRDRAEQNGISKRSQETLDKIAKVAPG